MLSVAFAVKVGLQSEQIPVLKEQVAQFAGQERQLLFPSLKLPAGQVMMSSHSFVVGSNQWIAGSGLQAH